jgi:hypothetical protein
MTDPSTHEFKTYCDGILIAHGTSAKDALAPYPGSVSRSEELAQMGRAVVEANELAEQANNRADDAEHRVADAEASSIRMLADSITRLSARVDSYEKAERERCDAEEQEAARLEAERLAQIASELAPIASPDDGELTLKHAPEKHDTGLAPMPFGTEPDPHPIPGPEPGTRLYPPRPQVAQPTAISLNSEA